MSLLTDLSCAEFTTGCVLINVLYCCTEQLESPVTRLKHMTAYEIEIYFVQSSPPTVTQYSYSDSFLPPKIILY